MSTQHQDEITSEEMVIQDINTEYLGIPRYLLMENAGAQIATFCEKLLKKSSKIAFFCGTGGNGGDGFVAARHLHGKHTVDVFVAGSAIKIKSKPAEKNFKALKLLHSINIREIKDSEDVKTLELDKYDLLVDGILGTGLRSNTIKQPLKALIETLNSNSNPKKMLVAIDIPSGLKKDGTAADTIINATHTVSLHKAKLGTYTYGGKVTVVPIGIPPESAFYTGPGLFSLYPKRSNLSHKGQNGKILIIGGSKDYHGSPILAGEAAFALNIDLVYFIAPEKITPVIRTENIRFIVKSYKEDFLIPRVVEELIRPMIAEVDTILLGPGLGTHKETMEAIKEIFKEIPENKTLIIDADALKTCKGEKLPKQTILTPHIGEFAILTGTKLDPKADISEKTKNILEAIKTYDPNIVWVVKGPIDFIVKGSKVMYNYTGSPAMTTGGTGDTLAGLITAIESVVKNPYYAATMGIFLMGKAGELAGKEIFSLEELHNSIPVVLKEIYKFIEEDETEILTKI